MTIGGDNSSDAIKDLQRLLNKLGSLLIVDGVFGQSTTAAVTDAQKILKVPPDQVDDGLLAALRDLPDPSPELTAAGVTFIGLEEVNSPAVYRAKYAFPTWPGLQSGITIGIGYDLKFADRRKLQTDWDRLLEPATIARLAAVSGKVGSPALQDQVKNVEIPLPAAVRVFLDHMLPDHITNTRKAYPMLDTLPPYCRAALISLVFNRGSSLEDKPGNLQQRRREMRRIRELLNDGDVDAVAAQFDSMTRLEPGIRRRANRASA
jgi:hypothetical protein